MTLSFPSEQVVAYAAVSGDDNSIHLSAAAARAAGLAQPIVHGMLLMAQFERLIEAWRVDVAVHAMSARFVRPALVGETLTFRGRVVAPTSGRAGGVMLRLLVESAQGQLVCVGEAAVTGHSTDCSTGGRPV